MAAHAEARAVSLAALALATLLVPAVRAEEAPRRPALLALASYGPRRLDLPLRGSDPAVQGFLAARPLRASWQMRPKDLTRLPGLLRIAGIFIHDVPVGEFGPLRLHFRIILE